MTKAFKRETEDYLKGVSAECEATVIVISADPELPKLVYRRGMKVISDKYASNVQMLRALRQATDDRLGRINEATKRTHVVKQPRDTVNELSVERERAESGENTIEESIAALAHDKDCDSARCSVYCPQRIAREMRARQMSE